MGSAIQRAGQRSTWLCHSDARQVSDLPKSFRVFFLGLRPEVGGQRP